MFLGDILNISGIFTIKEMYHEKYYQQGKVNCKLNLNNLIEQDKNKIEPAKSENKASRAVSVDISLSAAKSASIFVSVTIQVSVHLKRTLLHVNEMRFTAERRSIRRSP